MARVSQDEMEKMLLEITLGKPPTLHTPEADALRAKLTAEVKAIQAKGGAVAVPHEMPG